MTGALGRKQHISDAAAWQEAAKWDRETVTDSELDALVDKAVTGITSELAGGRRLAYGWSGGKDSQILRHVAELAGVPECILGMTTGLEWPAMLRWLTDHMPPGCEIGAVPIDLAWLAARPVMLFPQGRHGSRWFSVVQHRAQRDYFRAQKLDMLLLGRRRKDGNYVGPGEADRYTNSRGVTYWSPLADWTHEHALALIARENLPLPPCYDWPRGYQVGTGPWPARQWTHSTDHGFSECWSIDPDVIRHAATVLPQAAEWMQRTGRD